MSIVLPHRRACLPLTLFVLALSTGACSSDSAVSCTDDADCFTGESCNAGICAPLDERPEGDAGDAPDASADDDTSDASDTEVEHDTDRLEAPELPDDPFFRDTCTDHNHCGGCGTLNLNGIPGDYNPTSEQSLVCTDVDELAWLATTPNALELRLSWRHPQLIGDLAGARAALILCRDDATGFGDEQRCIHTRQGATINSDVFEPTRIDIDRTAPLEHQLNFRFPATERYHVGVAYVGSRDNLRALVAEVAADVYVIDEAPAFYPRFHEYGWLGMPGDIWYAGVIDWSQDLPNAKYTPLGTTYGLDLPCDELVHQACGSSEHFFSATSTRPWTPAL